MIEMSKNADEEEEELRRRFLFRALFLDGDNEADNNERQHRVGDKSTIEISSDSLHSNKYDDKVDGGREHSWGSRKCTYTKVALISQLESWDCGIACLLMIAHWLRDDREHDCQRCDDNRAKVLSDVGTQSIWTSDLLLQLQSWKMKQMAAKESETEAWFLPSPWSLAAGIAGTKRPDESLFFALASIQVMVADESYRDFQYYQNAFEEDRSRVARTFRDLHRQEVPMIQTTMNSHDDGKQKRCVRGLSLSTVIDIVQREDCLAIVLLDNCVLMATTRQNPVYAGHYIVLCGISDEPSHIESANSCESHDHRESLHGDECDEKTERFCFVLCNPDPSSSIAGSNYMYVTPKRLEASWRADGTDEDIIFLRKATNFKEPIAVASEGTIDSYETTGDHLSARIQALMRENYVALTGLFWTVYEHHFSPFCRN
jgi:hypothetical protein